MTALFDLLAVPLGWIFWAIYQLIPNYFGAMILFVLLVKLLSFPLSLKQQKSTADRAKLQPRLDRIQKKYGQDPKKVQEKQAALYEKEGVSPAGGCLPMLVTMIVLFGMIAVIYKPVSHMARLPEEVIETSISVVKDNTEDKKDLQQLADNSYYRELRMLQALEDNKSEIIGAIAKLDDDVLDGKAAIDYYNEMIDIRDEFNFFGQTMLERPSYNGWKPNWLWVIPILSAITALFTSLISQKYNKALTQPGQAGQGCTTFMTLGLMPIFSLYITFTVPGGVGIYWIFSNLLGLGQTVLLNKIYNPAKIRAQAEIEYEERRRQKREDKKRLAEARAKEQAELARQNNEEAAKTGGAKKSTAKKPAKKKTENNLADTTSTSSAEDVNTTETTGEGKE